MADGINKLSKLTGVSKESILASWKEVKANHKRLDECVGPHDFSIKKDPHKKISTDYICTKCGGWVNSINKIWYEKGLKHGHKDG